MSKYPEALKERARELYVPGVVRLDDVARILGVPRKTINRWVNPEVHENDRLASLAYKRSVPAE